jgi:hypothetical protein
MGTTPTFSGAAGAGSSLFPGSGSTGYSTLGITAVQAAQNVVTEKGTATTPTQTMTVQQALSGFQAQMQSDPAFTSTMSKELYDAGLMPQSVYNNGTMNDMDVYNAFKTAVLWASARGVPINDALVNLTASFKAQGGAKIKLPSVRYTATLTPMADVMAAGDAVFDKLLGRRMTASEATAVHGILNAAEMSGKTAEARSAYEQMLGYRGLNPDGTAAGGGPQDVANQAVAGVAEQGQAVTTPQGPNITNPQQMAQASVGGAAAPAVPGAPAAAAPAPTTVGGAALLPQQVTNAQGQVSTVSQGPMVIPYQQPPTAANQAYQYAFQNDRAEINGRAMAQAAQAIAQFIAQK